MSTFHTCGMKNEKSDRRSADLAADLLVGPAVAWVMYSADKGADSTAKDTTDWAADKGADSAALDSTDGRRWTRLTGRRTRGPTRRRWTRLTGRRWTRLTGRRWTRLTRRRTRGSTRRRGIPPPSRQQQYSGTTVDTRVTQLWPSHKAMQKCMRRTIWAM